MDFKKIIVILMSLLVLTACGQDSQYENISSAESGIDILTASSKELNSMLHIITDNKAGCKYMLYREHTPSSGTSDLIPLMNSDGTQDCSTVEE